MRGAVKHSVFGNCNSDNREGRPGFNLTTKFYAFPKPCLQFRKSTADSENDKRHIFACNKCKKCNDWVSSCRRQDRKFSNIRHITKDTYICDQHFVHNEVDINVLPLDSRVVNNLKHKRKRTSLDDKYMFIRNKKPCSTTSTPTIDEGNGEKALQANLIALDCSNVSVTPNFDALNMENDNKTYKINVGVSTATQDIEIKTNTDAQQNAVKCSELTKTMACQTDTIIKKNHVKSMQTTYVWNDIQKIKDENKRLRAEVTILKNSIKKTEKTNKKTSFPEFVKSLKTCDKKCVFYTGLIFQKILILFNFLSPMENLQYWGTETPLTLQNRRKLTILEELVLTLVRLRSGLLVQDLKFRFNLSEGLICKVCTTIIQHMYCKFNAIRPCMFPSREKIKENLPSTFKRLKNIRVIIDCAEFFCQVPSNFEQQGNLYSSYKAHTTFKVLLGCTPNGAISFVSDLFEGSISDRDLVIKSNLIDYLEDGDLVLADRGFTIKDLTDKKNVSLNIPPFLKGRDKLTAEEEIETKNIAKERIYVEHVVGRLKQFRILKKVLHLSMRGILSNIVFVCACLTNFQEPIVRKTETET